MKSGIFLYVLRFGALILGLLLAFKLSQYALFFPQRGSEWMIGLGGLVVLASGFLAARWLISTKPEYPLVEESPAAVEQKREALGISPREYAVLKALAQGHSNQEIANRLFIAESTVKTHVSRLLAKLEVKSRTQAVVKARQLGLV